jgi:hypothetical protein
MDLKRTLSLPFDLACATALGVVATCWWFSVSASDRRDVVAYLKRLDIVE